MLELTRSAGGHTRLSPVLSLAQTILRSTMGMELYEMPQKWKQSDQLDAIRAERDAEQSQTQTQASGSQRPSTQARGSQAGRVSLGAGRGGRGGLETLEEEDEEEEEDEDDGGAGGVGTPQRGSATQAAAPQGKKGKFSLGEHSIYAETAHCDGSGPTCACQPQKGSKSHSKKSHSYETNDQRKDHRSTSCAPSSAQNCKVPCLTPNLFLMALPAVKTP